MIQNNFDGIKYKHRKGLTLVELIIAVTVLVIGIAGILTVHHVAITTSTRAQSLTVASIEAQLIMESLVGRPWGNDPLSDVNLIGGCNLWGGADWGERFQSNGLWVRVLETPQQGTHPDAVSIRVTVYIYNTEAGAEAHEIADVNGLPDPRTWIFRHSNIINVKGTIT
ncbi:MAG: prepilin-type N-terminal cleavage/methylation domain-containing protein [Defluviitaleaceae bacterium]|nr:prepilin-type N-terminal cleavage/methylation domain-containing protein [Defluviitaleaceae bacterium]